MRTKRVASAVVAGMVLLLGLAGPGAAFASSVVYGGQATAVSAQANVLTTKLKVVLSDTGALDPSGKPRDATAVTLNNPPPLQIEAKTLAAHTEGGNNAATSDSEVQTLLIGLPGLTIKAGVVEAWSQAACDNGNLVLGGGADVVSLSINGKAYAVGNTPNQKIAIPGVATITIDEQIRTADSITVNAIHVSLPGVPGVLSADVVIAHAESSLDNCSCSQYPSPMISSFTPASGKPGTVVTVSGSAFTGLTEAWVGAAHDAHFTVVSDSTVKVTIPADATTGSIGLLNQANAAFSATGFTVTQ